MRPQRRVGAVVDDLVCPMARRRTSGTTPVTIRITKQYMAISPTMNDQWSGKILSRTLLGNCDDAEPLVDPVERRPARRSTASAASAGCAPRRRLALEFAHAGSRSRGRRARCSRSGRSGTRRRRPPAAAAAATGWPGRTPAGSRRARRRSTGGTGREAGGGRACTARPGSRRGCRSWRRRPGRRLPVSRPGWIFRGASPTLMSRVGLRASSVCPRGTRSGPRRPEVAGLHRACRPR